MSNYPTSTGSKLSHDLDNMADNASAIKKDVAALAHSAADSARHGAAELRDGTKRAVGTAKEKLGEGYEDAKHRASDAAHSFQESVVAHPMLSISLAAGAGVLLGLILSRRS